jgi:hypothetical protein
LEFACEKISERCRNIGLPLLSSRVTLKKELHLGSRGSQTKWSNLRPDATKLLAQLTECFADGLKVMSEADRWSTPPQSTEIPSNDQIKDALPEYDFKGNLTPAERWGLSYMTYLSEHIGRSGNAKISARCAFRIAADKSLAVGATLAMVMDTNFSALHMWQIHITHVSAEDGSSAIAKLSCEHRSGLGFFAAAYDRACASAIRSDTLFQYSLTWGWSAEHRLHATVSGVAPIEVCRLEVVPPRMPPKQGADGDGDCEGGAGRGASRGRGRGRGGRGRAAAGARGRGGRGCTTSKEGVRAVLEYGNDAELEAAANACGARDEAGEAFMQWVEDDREETGEADFENNEHETIARFLAHPKAMSRITANLASPSRSGDSGGIAHTLDDEFDVIAEAALSSAIP